MQIRGHQGFGPKCAFVDLGVGLKDYQGGTKVFAQSVLLGFGGGPKGRGLSSVGDSRG